MADDAAQENGVGLERSRGLTASIRVAVGAIIASGIFVAGRRRGTPEVGCCWRWCSPVRTR